MTQPKVLISDKMDPRAAQIFRERWIQVDEITGKTPDELKAIIGDYDGLAIRSSTKVTKDILSVAGNLKVVGRAGVGASGLVAASSASAATGSAPTADPLRGTAAARSIRSAVAGARPSEPSFLTPPRT